MSADEAALLATIYAAPHDDGPRLVYADWLLERGDPRGEFIMLQLDRHRRDDALATAHENALLDRNLTAWLGPLAPVVEPGTVVFRRGFLAECTARFVAGVSADEILADPRWATVEKLSAPPQALGHPGMRSLWSLGPLLPGTLQETIERGALPRVTELRLDIDGARGQFVALQALRQPSALARLPSVHRVELLYRDEYELLSPDLDPAHHEQLLASPLVRQLDALLVRKRLMLPSWAVEDLDEPRPDLRAWADTVRKPHCPRVLTLQPGHGWTFILWREQAEVMLRIDWNPARATGDLQVLEHAVTNVQGDTFARVHVHIDGVERAPYASLLGHALRRIPGLTYSARQPLASSAL